MLRKMSSAIMLPLAIILMVAFALFREVISFPIPDLIPNPDGAWLLYAAQRLADGQKLYVDILETNPPLIVWLNLLPVYIGGWLNISPFLVFPCLVTLLNITSLALVAGIMRRHKIFAAKPALQIILLYISFAFFLLSPALYGQRELLFIALVLPYLFFSLSSSLIPNRSSLIIVVMAAIGFAIKPFFLLLWGMNELAVAIERRSVRSIFAWHNWVIGLVQLVYIAAIYFITPEYISEIIPALQVVYFTFNSPWKLILLYISVVVGITLFLLILAKIRGDYLRLVIRVLVWLTACTGLIILQRKEWINHLYPMVFMAGLALSVTMIYLINEWKILRLDIGHRKFIALCSVIAVLLLSAYVDGVFTYNMFVKPSKLSQKLMVEIENKASGKYVYPFVNSIQPSFPAIALSNGIFRGGFHHLWPMTGLIIREQEGDNTPEFVRVRSWFMDKIVHDFADHPPELVWVDDNINMEKIAGYDIEPQNRDIIKVLSRDVRFAVLWRNYEKYKDIESESYPDEEKNKTEEEKLKKPERYSLYIRKK